MGGRFDRAWRHRAGGADCLFLRACISQRRKAPAQTSPSSPSPQKLSRTIPKNRQRHQGAHPATPAPASSRTPPHQSHARPDRRPAAHPRSRRTAATAIPAVMQHSRAITRKSASNLALAFVLLPRAKRDAMSALYAFCREVDDVADKNPSRLENAAQQLAAWRDDVKRACENQPPQFPVNQELQPVIRQFQPALRIVRRTDQGLRNGFGHQALRKF